MPREDTLYKKGLSGTGSIKNLWFERDSFSDLEGIVNQLEKISPKIKAEINDSIDTKSG